MIHGPHSRKNGRHAEEEGGPEATGGSNELLAVVRAAEEEMRELGDEYVSTEHLIVALAAQAGAAGNALRSLGATRENLLKALAEVRGGHRVTPSCSGTARGQGARRPPREAKGRGPIATGKLSSPPSRDPATGGRVGRVPNPGGAACPTSHRG